MKINTLFNHGYGRDWEKRGGGLALATFIVCWPTLWPASAANCLPYPLPIVSIANGENDRPVCACREPGAPESCGVPYFWWAGLVAHPLEGLMTAEYAPRQHPPQEARDQAHAPRHHLAAAKSCLVLSQPPPTSWGRHRGSPTYKGKKTLQKRMQKYIYIYIYQKICNHTAKNAKWRKMQINK